ncbi:MAG: GAF domain-containing protein [Chloroflexi bacterium]|nr:MAG: GAF domain-containing protein [Chloroflexota bacterium]
MATARTFNLELDDVLDRLRSAAAELERAGDPEEIAETAAELLLALTRSSEAVIVLGTRFFSRAAATSLQLDDDAVAEVLAAARGRTGRATQVELHAGGEVIGTMAVARATEYTGSDRQAMAIFASNVAAALDSAEKLRSAERVERAHELAVQVLLAVSSQPVSGQNLSDFYRQLAETFGEFVGADKVVFWRLRDDGKLAPIQGGFGVDRAFLSRLKPTRCEPDGDDLASRVVYQDLIFRANAGEPPEFGYVLETLGVSNAISVAWRAGDERLGLIAAYDSRRPTGFSREDTWVLQKAALAAGLVTELKRAQDDLSKSVERLTKVDSARQMLLKNMSTVVDKERKRFVSELHDDALQKLTAAELQVARLAPDGVIDQSALDALKAVLEQTESALRRLVFEVRPPALESPDGLAQSIRDRVAMLEHSGITCELELDLPTDLNLDVRSMVFRQVAEAIGNVERHSEATLVKVSVTEADGGVTGIIEDNGLGFVVADRSNLPGHLGLLALRERALMAGGRYKIESQPGSGARIEFWVPLEQ